jgi:hypothetical protein
MEGAMRRVVIGSEVGSRFTPGFGALHQLRRPRVRLRIPTPYKWVGGALLALVTLAAIGHLH